MAPNVKMLKRILKLANINLVSKLVIGATPKESRFIDVLIKYYSSSLKIDSISFRQDIILLMLPTTVLPCRFEVNASLTTITLLYYLFALAGFFEKPGLNRCYAGIHPA
jgi:hypothetical protein